MANTRNNPLREGFRSVSGDRRGSGTGHESSGTRFNPTTVEKRGLNPEVSNVKVRPASPKPIVTNQTTPKPARGDK